MRWPYILALTGIFYLAVGGCAPVVKQEPPKTFTPHLKRDLGAATPLVPEPAALAPGPSAPMPAPVTHLFWLQDGQVILRAAEREARLNLADGRLQSLPEAEEVVGVSPDGAWLVVRRREDDYRVTPAWLEESSTGKRWQLPAWPSGVQWRSPGLALIDSHEHPWGLVDTAAQSWMAGGYYQPVRLGNGTLCYTTQWGEYLLCHPHGRQDGLQMSTYRPSVGHTVGKGVPDPQHERIAFLDVRSWERAKQITLTATAHATPPLPPNPSVDTLFLYDGDLLQRFALPQRTFVQELLWSADGGQIGLRIRLGETDDQRPFPEPVSAFLVLEIASGQWRLLGRLGDETATLERVVDDGVIVQAEGRFYHLTDENTARPWLPGAQPVEWLGEPRSSSAGRDLALLDGDSLLIETSAGQRYSWQLGGRRVVRVSVSGDYQWLAVQSAEGQLHFIRRSPGK